MNFAKFLIPFFIEHLRWLIRNTLSLRLKFTMNLFNLWFGNLNLNFHYIEVLQANLRKKAYTERVLGNFSPSALIRLDNLSRVIYQQYKLYSLFALTLLVLIFIA